MKFFRANQPPRSAEDEAAAVRLLTVASRGKAGSAPDWAAQGPPESALEAQPPAFVQ
jgi:hypothetical protein